VPLYRVMCNVGVVVRHTEALEGYRIVGMVIVERNMQLVGGSFHLV